MLEPAITYQREVRDTDSSGGGAPDCVNVHGNDRGNTSSVPRIKIALIFDQVPQAGGAFHQSITAVEQFKRVCGEIFEIQFFHLGDGGALWVNEIGLESTPLRETWTSKIVEAILHYAPRSISRRLELISPREKVLTSHGIDLVYFTSPNTLALFLRKLKYIVTLYDICHRDFPEFPETADFAKFQSCEAYNWQALAKAVLVLVDSKLLMSKVCEIYGVQPDRVLAMPYGVSHYIRKGSAAGETLRRKYNLEKPFLFYPAQFWAHKNHVRILQALQILKDRGQVVDVAFAGSDKGERVHVEAAAVQMGLTDQVHFLGFVPSEDLAGLYSESVALIMPTYFGPTNIPPLEAWSLDVPVIYSKHLSAGIEEGVLAADSDVAESIADAIEKVTEEGVRRELIAGGRRCLERVHQEIATSEGSLREHIVRFARRRETWASHQADPGGRMSLDEEHVEGSSAGMANGTETRVKMATEDAWRFIGLLQLYPFDMSTPEGRSRERYRRVVLSAGAAAAAKLVSVATALISIPLTLHYLGPERYGMWMTMSSLLVMFAFADLGIGHGMMNIVADSSGKEDRPAIRAAVSSGFFVLTIIAATILLLFAAAYPFVSWFEIFNVKSEAARLEAGPALAGAVVCFVLGIPLGVVQRVQMGLQEGYAANLWRCLGSILGLIGVLVVIWLKWGLLWLVVAFLGGPLVASIINSIAFFGASERDLAPQRRYVSREMIARIARIGLLFFGLQIAMAVAFASDNVIIAQSLGAEAVTDYAVSEKMFSLIGVIVSMVLFPLWPAYGEAIARGDQDWVRRALLLSLTAAIVTTAVLSLVLVVFGTRLIALWTGPVVDAPFMLLVALGLWKVIDAGGNAVSMFLNGANVVRFQLIIAALMTPLAIVLKVILVTQIGISGVVWATIIANLATVPPTFWFVRKWLRERQGAFR